MLSCLFFVGRQSVPGHQSVPGFVPGLKSRKAAWEKGYRESVLMSQDFGGSHYFF